MMLVKERLEGVHGRQEEIFSLPNHSITCLEPGDTRAYPHHCACSVGALDMGVGDRQVRNVLELLCGQFWGNYTHGTSTGFY